MVKRQKAAQTHLGNDTVTSQADLVDRYSHGQCLYHEYSPQQQGDLPNVWQCIN